MEHTKGKWEAVKSEPVYHIIAPDGNFVDDFATIWNTNGKAEANARHICKCVNSHDALLEACKAVVSVVTPSKLKGTIKENFSEQVALSQLSKVIAQIKEADNGTQ